MLQPTDDRSSYITVQSTNNIYSCITSHQCLPMTDLHILQSTNDIYPCITVHQWHLLLYYSPPMTSTSIYPGLPSPHALSSSLSKMATPRASLSACSTLPSTQWLVTAGRGSISSTPRGPAVPSISVAGKIALLLCCSCSVCYYRYNIPTVVYWICSFGTLGNSNLYTWNYCPKD